MADESSGGSREKSDARSPKKKIFIDAAGNPMKFAVMPNRPSSFINALKRLGGVFDMELGNNSIHLAPPGWFVPVDAKYDYYSYAFIKDSMAAGKVVDISRYLLPKGKKAPEIDGVDQNEATHEVAQVTSTAAIKSPSFTSQKGRIPFTLEEDMAILHFVYSGNLGELNDEQAKSIPKKIWDDAANRGLFGPHSGESSRSRYQKMIMADIDKYGALYKKWLSDQSNKTLTVVHNLEHAEDAIEMIGDDSDSETALQHSVAAGSLSNEKQFTASQSQIGPVISQNPSAKPLLCSTPFVGEPSSNVKGTQYLVGAPILQADVVAEVALPEDSEVDDVIDESPRESPSAGKMKLRSRRKTMPSKPHVKSPSKRARGSLAIRADEIYDKNSPLKLNPKAAALAKFVATDDNLEEECTQTVIPKDSNKMTQLSMEDDAILKEHVDITASTSNLQGISTQQPAVPPISSSANQNEPHVEKPLANSSQGVPIEESSEFKMISALAKRYRLHPCVIIDILRQVDGNWGDAIIYIECGDAALKVRRDARQAITSTSNVRICSRSSGKEN